MLLRVQDITSRGPAGKEAGFGQIAKRQRVSSLSMPARRAAASIVRRAFRLLSVDPRRAFPLCYE
jgi:hypothetical protein